MVLDDINLCYISYNSLACRIALVLQYCRPPPHFPLTPQISTLYSPRLMLVRSLEICSVDALGSYSWLISSPTCRVSNRESFHANTTWSDRDLLPSGVGRYHLGNERGIMTSRYSREMLPHRSDSMPCAGPPRPSANTSYIPK